MPKEKMEIDKSEYQALKAKKKELRKAYLNKRDEIRESFNNDIDAAKDEYKSQLAELKDPLKAEKARLKIERKKRSRELNQVPKRTLLEEIGSSISHGVGVLIGVACLVLMLLKSDTPLEYVSAILYGSCAILQMLFSCLYHAFPSSMRVKRLFRRFDYSSIYLLLGGTFVPLFLLYMPDKMGMPVLGYILFGVQWGLLFTGITFVGVFGPGRLRPLHYSLYFVLGWSALLFLPFWAKNDLPLLFYILGGGVAYTLGMIPFAVLKKKPGAHFIWHIFSMAGNILMWVGIYLYVF